MLRARPSSATARDLADVDGTHTFHSPAGRTLVLDHDGCERLEVFDPAGRFELAVRFTAAGPVLEVAAIGLRLRSDADVTVDCERLRLHARDSIEITSGGALVEHVAGDRVSEVGGVLATIAAGVSVHAEDGELDLSASEDARVVGRRVLLNP